MLQFALLHNDDFNARINLVGVFQTGWLEREAKLLEVSKLSILGSQLQRTALAFVYYPDRSSHYATPQPLLGLAAGGFFLIGLFRCTLRAWIPNFLPMVVWWWAGIAGAALTVNPPESQRLNVIAVPTAFFLAVGVATVFGRFATATRRSAPRRWVPCVAVALVALLAARSSWIYFTSLAPSLPGNPHAVLATRLARYARGGVSRLEPAWSSSGLPRCTRISARSPSWRRTCGSRTSSNRCTPRSPSPAAAAL